MNIICTQIKWKVQFLLLNLLVVTMCWDKLTYAQHDTVRFITFMMENHHDVDKKHKQVTSTAVHAC